MQIIKRTLGIKPSISHIGMTGVVHHAQYLYWFEEGRMQIISEIMRISEALEAGVAGMVTRVECRYKFPVRYGDELVLTTHFSKAATMDPRMKFVHFLINRQTKIEHVHALIEMILVSTVTLSPLRELTPELLERYMKLS
jgi:YbgC/YbaW family acyl-CoA thioester hydrolase